MNLTNQKRYSQSHNVSVSSLTSFSVDPLHWLFICATQVLWSETRTATASCHTCAMTLDFGLKPLRFLFWAPALAQVISATPPYRLLSFRHPLSWRLQFTHRVRRPHCSHAVVAECWIRSAVFIACPVPGSPISKNKCPRADQQQQR